MRAATFAAACASVLAVLALAACGGGAETAGGEEAPTQEQIAHGLEAFIGYGCANCHALEAASADAVSGPDLDRTLRSSAEAAGVPLDEWVRASIVDPDASVTAGYPSGTMPLDYGTRLPEGDLDSLVAFVVDAVGEAGP